MKFSTAIAWTELQSSPLPPPTCILHHTHLKTNHQKANGYSSQLQLESNCLPNSFL